MEQIEHVFLVLVTTKARGTIRRIDSVHRTFVDAKHRVETMYLNPDELATIEARNFYGG